MKLVIASNNTHKINEIKGILSARFDPIISQKEAGIDVEVVEDGATFEQNAVKKAEEIAALLPECAVLADDSGLEVDFLNGAPGVHSARFAQENSSHGEHGADSANNEKLLRLMQDVPEEKRGCAFVSCVALARPGMPTITATGRCPGHVMTQPKGENGFGYDPIFYVAELDKTYAELTAEEKNAVSHRKRALARLEAMLAN